MPPAAAPTTRVAGYFPASTAARLAKVPPSTLAYWARTGLVVPSRRAERPRLFSFEDVRDLCVAQRLREQGARGAEIRAVVEFVRTLACERLAGAELEVVGGKVVYRNRALGIDPVVPAKGGQRHLAVTMADVFRELGADESGEVRRLRPAARILVDPEVRGGEPVIEGTRIPVELIGSMASDGMPASEIVLLYPSLEPADVEAAEAWVRGGTARAAMG